MRIVTCACEPGTGSLLTLDGDQRQRISKLRFAARDEPNDVRTDRRKLERGDRRLQLDDRAVFDRAGNAVGDLDAALFARRDVADMRAAARKQRRVSEFVVEIVAVEPPASDEIDEPFGNVEAQTNARCRSAALVTKREGRTHRHSRFQLAFGRNDERSEPLGQRRCSGREDFRQRAHDAGTFRRREAVSRDDSRMRWRLLAMLAVHEDRLAAAVERLGSENAFEILARARELEARGRRVVHMEIGEPDFDTPEHIKKAAVDALYDNHTHYTPSGGLPSLRATIAQYASRFRHVTPEWGPENVVVGPGAKPVIWNTLSALLNPGRRVRLFRPRLSGVCIVRELSSSDRSRDSLARVA